jgi:hypothetical protein
MRKIMMGIFLALMILLVATVATQRAQEMREAYEYTETIEYRVRHGDTLWGIAGEYTNNRHNRQEVIHMIKVLSDRTSSNLMPGDLLIIPLFTILQED